MKTNIRCALLTWAILLGASLSNTVSAADVAGMVEPCFACRGKGGVSSVEPRTNRTQREDEDSCA